MTRSEGFGNGQAVLTGREHVACGRIGEEGEEFLSMVPHVLGGLSAELAQAQGAAPPQQLVLHSPVKAVPVRHDLPDLQPLPSQDLRQLLVLQMPGALQVLHLGLRDPVLPLLLQGGFLILKSRRQTVKKKKKNCTVIKMLGSYVAAYSNHHSRLTRLFWALEGCCLGGFGSSVSRSKLCTPLATSSDSKYKI